jgi:hypothetical protein
METLLLIWLIIGLVLLVLAQLFLVNGIKMAAKDYQALCLVIALWPISIIIIVLGMLFTAVMRTLGSLFSEKKA